MSDIRDWSVTPASNVDLFPEGMAPSAVNDGARAVQAELAKLIKDAGGTLTTAGSATAYALTLSTSPAALSDGLYFSATIDETNTGAATLTVTGGAAFASKKIRMFAAGVESDLTAGAMVENGHYQFHYDSAADGGTGAYILINPTVNGWVLIRKQTVTGTTAATFTTGITSDYSAVVVVGSSIVMGTTSQNLYLQVSANNGSSWLQGTTGQYIQHYRSAAASTFSDTYQDNVTGLYCVGNAGSSAAGFTATVFNPGSMLLRHNAHVSAVVGLNSASSFLTFDVKGQSVQPSGGGVNGLRFLPSSGTFSGTLSLYGIR